MRIKRAFYLCIFSMAMLLGIVDKGIAANASTIPDISGIWKGKFKGEKGGHATVTVKFKQDGENIKGKCSTTWKGVQYKAIISGTIFNEGEDVADWWILLSGKLTSPCAGKVSSVNSQGITENYMSPFSFELSCCKGYDYFVGSLTKTRSK